MENIIKIDDIIYLGVKVEIGIMGINKPFIGHFIKPTLFQREPNYFLTENNETLYINTFKDIVYVKTL